MKKVIIITGPTASGKTAVSVELAKKINAEIISADSMQIYSEMQVGTARPFPEEMQGIPHHLMGFVSPDAHYSTAQYKADAEALIEDIISRGKTPMIVGGTGLYINSLTYDIDFSAPEADLSRREELSREYDEKGADYMHALLIEKDPEAAARIHKNDKVRVIRAIEIAEKGGRKEYNFRKPSEKYDFSIFAVTKPREKLYSDINRRVDIMFEMGLEKEARSLYDNYGEDIQAFAAIGYKEFIPYFKGEIDLPAVSEAIKLNTRRYAKRQLTWLRPDERINWINVAEFDCISSILCDIMKRIDG